MSVFSKIAAGVNPEKEPLDSKDSPKPAPARRGLTVGESLGRDMLLTHTKALESEIERLTEEAKGKGIQSIHLDEIHEVEGRKRTLDAEQYSQLLENLRHNDLVTPIIVRKREAGGYELVSGHNRSQAFRDLGRESIPAIIADIKDKDANKDAFFANLIHPALPDYEKFLGIQNLISENDGVALDKVAEQIGISKGHLTRLLSFNRLPLAAHDLLKKNPGCLGSNSSLELAVLTESGHADLVVKSIEMILDNKLEQTKAKDWIQKESAGQSDKPVKEKIKPIAIKKGKEAFCNMRRAQKVIRLEFQSHEQAEALEKHIHEFLKTLAKAD